MQVLTLRKVLTFPFGVLHGASVLVPTHLNIVANCDCLLYDLLLPFSLISFFCLELLSMNYSLQSNLAQQEKTSADLRKENIKLKLILPSEKDTKKTQERFLEKRKTTNIPEINYYKEL